MLGPCIEGLFMNRDKLIELLKDEEGFRAHPYTCPTGHLTIGYGHNLENGISLAAAEFILLEDIETAVHNCEVFISCWDKLSETRQTVLADMCFNMGWKGLSRFAGMLGCLEKSDYKGAADHILQSNYAVQVPNRAKKMAEAMRLDRWL
jgi:lysozyme